MALFESLLALLLVSILLLKISGHIGAPYPTMLAFSGACVAALPWAPEIDMQPRLALALFIAPALLDAAYDLPPRELRRDWLPLTWLALIAVVLTTAAVAWIGWAWQGMPLAAAIALGAIVAPPDAAAAAAVLTKFPLPRRTMAILQGESLLNDATALLIFTAAVAMATWQETSVVDMIPGLLVAAPGGVVLGLAFAKLYFLLKRWLGQTLTARVSEFVVTFGTWVVAEHVHVSPILAVVAFAMTAAHYGPERQTARDRVHSYAIWEVVVFVLNVLAFLLMGLQARTILARLDTLALVGGDLVWCHGAGRRHRRPDRVGDDRDADPPPVSPARIVAIDDDARGRADFVVRHARAGHAGDGVRAAVRISTSRRHRPERLHRRAWLADDPGAHGWRPHTTAAARAG